ncbi:MAG: flagellin [Phycisphaerae bacterium]|jgi:flagellin
MARINTNIAALQSVRHLQGNYADLSVRLERLATGLRINHGRDDPAGLIASERLRLETRALEQAIENSTRASNVITTTEGALNEVNALLLDLQALVVEAANKGAMTPEEINANQLQIDSILASIDRVSTNTAFAGKKLLDGSQAYVLSALPTNAIGAVSVFEARLPSSVDRTVTVEVTASAQTATLAFVGENPAGVSTTSAASIEVHGTLGTTILSFADATTLDKARDAINAVSTLTGVSAVVSSPGGGVASALVLHSTTLGSDAFVSVTPIQGNFVNPGNANTAFYDAGADAAVLVDGQRAYVKGLRADVRAGALDTRIYLTKAFAQTLSSASFTITGGGTLFQLGPEVTPNAQVNVGLNAVRTTQLGNAVIGRLSTLRSGGDNDLASEKFLKAQQITEEAIDQVSAYRGRLGNIQRNTIDPNIRSHGITLENVIASESVIRDADMAEEVSNLTRAQILVQSTQSTLQIANSLPNLVLSLLQ